MSSPKIPIGKPGTAALAPQSLAVGPVQNAWAVSQVVLAVRRAAIDSRAPKLELEAVRACARECIAWNRQQEERYEGMLADDRAFWDERIWPLVSQLCSKQLSGSPDEAVETLAALTEVLGGQPDFSSVAAFDAFMETGESLDLTSGAGRRAESGQTSAIAEACADLGPVSKEGLGSPAETDLVLLKTLLRGPQITDRFVGVHVAADRYLKGKLKYWHHGMMLSESELVHFSGEPGKPFSEASVERVAWAGFAKESGEFVTRTPDLFHGSRIASLQRNASVLRALERVGDIGYSLTSNNCEHFAMWAQLGAEYSHQARTYKRNGLREDQDQRADSLGEIFTCRVDRFEPSKTALSSKSGRLVLDLGRAYADFDSGRADVWVPLWDTSDGRSPAVGVERPWSDTFGRTWGEHPRTTSATSAKCLPIASLVWFEGIGTVWLTVEGKVRMPKFDVLAVFEDRIAPSRVRLGGWLAQTPMQGLAHNLLDRGLSMLGQS